MVNTATRTGMDELIKFVLPPTPEHVSTARHLVRVALQDRGFGDQADDAELITSELVTNAIWHGSADPALDEIEVTLIRDLDRDAVAIIVADSSSGPPVRRTTTTESEQGRGLQIVEALSARWGWHSEDGGGTAVYAVLVKEG